MREAIAAQMRAERSQANRQACLAKLLEQNPPAINELVLSKVLARASDPNLGALPPPRGVTVP